MVPTAADRRQSLRGEELRSYGEGKTGLPGRTVEVPPSVHEPLGAGGVGPRRGGRPAPSAVPVGIGVAARQPGDSGADSDPHAPVSSVRSDRNSTRQETVMTTLDTHGAADTDAEAAAFVERLFGAVLATMDLQAVYLGDRLGYYRALAEGPLTSAELAARTGTAERYAREWLEQQAVTGDPAHRPPGQHRRAPVHAARGLRRPADGRARPRARRALRPRDDRLRQAGRPAAGGLPHRRWGELGTPRRRRPRRAGRRQPPALPRAVGPGVPAVDPRRRRRATGRRSGGRRRLWPGLVGDRDRAGLPRRHGRRL